MKKHFCPTCLAVPKGKGRSGEAMGAVEGGVMIWGFLWWFGRDVWGGVVSSVPGNGG